MRLVLQSVCLRVTALTQERSSVFDFLHKGRTQNRKKTYKAQLGR